LITLSLPVLYGWFINEIQKDITNAFRHAWNYGIAYIGLNLIKWFFFGLPRIWEQKLAFRIGKNFFTDIYNDTINKELKWHQSEHSGSFINRLKKAHESLRAFFQTGFQYFYTISRFIFCSAAMLYLSPLFGTAGVLLGIAAVMITIKFDRPLSRYLSDANEKEHRFSSALADSLSNINTVKTLRLEKQMIRNILFRFDEIFPPFKRSIVLGEWKWFTTDMIVGVIYILLILGYVYKNSDPGAIFYIGGLVTLIAYVTQFTGVFYEFAWQYNQVIKYNVDVNGVYLAGQWQANINDQEIDAKPSYNWNTLGISNIIYEHELRYEGSLNPFIIEPCSIEVKRGGKIAIIGESGSGKTTFVKILGGLYMEKSALDIIADNTYTVPQHLFFNQVVLITQEPEVFENTIRYNITLGVEYSESQILKACDIACFTEVLEGLPAGMDTLITERGFNLSGGQKQRLALARGVLAAESKNVIILDEPTSNVDLSNEKRIYENIFAHFSSKVIISTLHRLYLLPEFEKVYIFKNGQIISTGTYEELQEKNSFAGLSQSTNVNRQ